MTSAIPHLEILGITSAHASPVWGAPVAALHSAHWPRGHGNTGNRRCRGHHERRTRQCGGAEEGSRSQWGTLQRRFQAATEYIQRPHPDRPSADVDAEENVVTVRVLQKDALGTPDTITQRHHNKTGVIVIEDSSEASSDSESDLLVSDDEPDPKDGEAGDRHSGNPGSDMGKEDVPELSDGDDCREDNDTTTAVLERM